MKSVAAVLALAAAALGSASNFASAELLPGKARCKHSRGHHPKGSTPGKGTQRARAKQSFLAESSRQGNAIAKERADRKTYAKWFATLSPADQEFAREHKLHKPMPEEGFRRVTSDSDEDALALAEREPIPESDRRGTHNGRPVIATAHEPLDAMEPVDGSDLAHLSAEAVETAVEDFGAALRWALEPAPSDLAGIGKRSIVIIATMTPDIAEGLPLDRDLARAFLSTFEDFRLSETLIRLQESGLVYRRILDWAKNGSSLSALGERLQLVAHKIRPDLIDGATNAKLGNPTNKSRQAINKLSQCIRDTFAGLKAFCERANATRLACQRSQLARA